MKAMLLTVAIVAAALSATEARADNLTACTLTVNGGSWAVVGVQQSFTYEVNIVQQAPMPGPRPPDPFTIVFYGEKDGVADILPPGETYPGTFGYGYSVLGGYWNPGGVSGWYRRWAMIRAPNEAYNCETNAVWVYLY